MHTEGRREIKRGEEKKEIRGNIETQNTHRHYKTR